MHCNAWLKSGFNIRRITNGVSKMGSYGSRGQHDRNKHEKMAQIMACMLVPGSLPHFSFAATATQNEEAES